MEGTTAEEFERQYAARSGITVERLRELGRVVRPCYCDSPDCEGWQSISKENAEELDRINFRAFYARSKANDG